MRARGKAAVALSGLVGLLVVRMIPAPAAAETTSIVLPRCQGVIALLKIPRANVRPAGDEERYIPSAYPLVSYPEDRVGLDVLAEHCVVETRDGRSLDETYWSQVRLQIVGEHGAPGEFPLHAYGLTWVADEPRFNGWAEDEIEDAVDGFIFLGREFELEFTPSAVPAFGHLHYESPTPHEFAFALDAHVQDAEHSPSVPGIRVHVFHSSEGQTIRFDSAREETRVGFAAGVVTAQHGTTMAALMTGGEGCSVDEGRAAVSCPFHGDEDSAFVVLDQVITRHVT